jgi:ParB-like chromosome segregation protein Spo0J
VQPLVVRQKGGVYEILDGAHRFRALKELGETAADCVLVEDNDEEARMRTLTMNRLRGRLDNEALAGLLDSLSLDDEAIRRALAYSEKELGEIRALLDDAPNLDFDIPEKESYELLDFYLAADEADLVRKALDKTGEDDRSKALVKMAREYLDV